MRVPGTGEVYEHKNIAWSRSARFWQRRSSSPWGGSLGRDLWDPRRCIVSGGSGKAGQGRGFLQEGFGKVWSGTGLQRRLFRSRGQEREQTLAPDQLRK